MLQRLERGGDEVLGRGVYGAAEAVRLLNFRRDYAPPSRGGRWRGRCAAMMTGSGASRAIPIRSGGPTTRTTPARPNSVFAT